MENNETLIGPRFDSYSPDSFYSYVKGLIKTKNPNASKEVQGIAIKQDGSRLSLRFTRSDKVLQRNEVTKLAQEYKIEELGILLALEKRKLGILYEPHDTRIESDKSAIEKAKADAKDQKRRAKRKDGSGDKLLEPVDNSGVLSESQLQPS